jgi:hypothetical protein
MLEPNDARGCLTCGKTLRGRIDKKFCDDYCRNSFNNQQKSRGCCSGYVRSVNNALLKNRRILESLLPDGAGMARASKDKLLLMGFHFRYSTHQYTTKTGKTYFFCYDCGYLPLEKDWLLVVKKKED